MSSPLSEVDRELLGEVFHNNGATMAEANGGTGLGAHENSHGNGFTPLNATAGTLIKVSSNGDEVKAGKVSQHSMTHLTIPLPSTIVLLSTLTSS